MDALTVSILGLGAAQLLVIFRAAQWTGEKNEELKGKASTAELEKVRTELATAKAANAEAATAAARAVIASAVSTAVAEAAAKIADEMRRTLRRELEDIRRRELEGFGRRLDALESDRDTLTRLEERAARFVSLDDTVRAWSRAGARLEWRVEAIEEAIRKKLGSHPRMFAVREPPPPLESFAVFDPESTSPGIGQQPAFLPPPPAVPRPRAGSGPLSPARPPIPREEPESEPPPSSG